MQEIIKISQTVIGIEEQNSINARDLHTNLKIKKDFSNWIKSQISTLGLEQNIDYIVFAQKGEKGGRPSKDYIITLDTAKHISMASRTAKGKEVRQYFIQAEKKLKEVGTVQNLTPVINTMLEMMSVQTKLLEKLVDNQEAQVKTISKEQMKKIRANTYIIAGIIREVDPYMLETEIMRRLYTELNSRMGVTSYYDIAAQDFEEVIKLQDRTIKRWEDKRDLKDKRTKVDLAKEIKELVEDIELF
jgi:phage anti-repressor protein